jgi:hypothetical protein
MQIMEGDIIRTIRANHEMMASITRRVIQAATNWTSSKRLITRRFSRRSKRQAIAATLLMSSSPKETRLSPCGLRFSNANHCCESSSLWKQTIFRSFCLSRAARTRKRKSAPGLVSLTQGRRHQRR